MELDHIDEILTAIQPRRAQLQQSLLDKDLRECKLMDLSDIMLPFDELLEIFSRYHYDHYTHGIDFINELLGEVATEHISHHLGLSYVMNLYELLDESLDAAAVGIDSSDEFELQLQKLQKMFKGVQEVQLQEHSSDETVMQEPPNADILEDGSISDFINEVIEGLEIVEENLMTLEEDPAALPDLIDQIFRVMHTIKGTSGFLGMPHIGTLAHKAEDILSEIREGTRGLEKLEITFLFQAVDTLKNLTNQLREIVEGGMPLEVNVGHFYITLDDCIQGKTSGEAAAPSTTVATPKPIAEVPKVDVTQKVDITQKQGAIPMPNDTTSETKISEPAATTEDAAESVEATAAQQVTKQQPQKTTVVQEMLKVPAEKLDELSNLVGELVVALSLLAQNPSLSELEDRATHAQMDHLEKITEVLRDKVLAIRMFPIGVIFTKLTRQVRDLAQKSNKQVHLDVQGADTLVDKMIIDNIYPPLIHIIRNSIDHGLEETTERGEKSSTGNVLLQAQHLGDSIQIVVKDDGKGLDAQKILAKALQKGLAFSDRTYTDKEIFNFIFQPGFSTAEKITDISGRGVGLDVVRKTVENLRGKISIDSEKGKGTTFSLKLPLTTSIIEGLVVSVGESRFILPILDVYQTLTPDAEDLKGVQSEEDEFFLFQEEVVPIIRLYEIYGLQPYVREPEKSVMIVVQLAHKKFGLMVDELLHRQQVVIQNLGERFTSLQGVSGGTILGDGRVGLILDPQALLASVQTKKRLQA